MSAAVIDDAFVVRLPEDPAERELLEWWLSTAYADFKSTVPKILEYGGDSKVRPGSADLHLIGDNLATLLSWDDADEATKQELGCWLYLQGKIARLVSNYQQQQPGKPDTWFDGTIYTMMARRLQAVGRWP